MTEEPNIEYIINLAGEDLAFRQKFIGIVKEEFPAERRSYIENVTQNNFKRRIRILKMTLWPS